MRLKVPADISQYPKVLDWVESGIASSQIQLCVEEIFINICSYAYPEKKGEVEIVFRKNAEDVEFEFIDTGIEFNPLEYRRQKPIDEPGGFGIYIVNHLMDSVTYERRNDQNHLKLTKKNS
jgi:anti-sigma regulatory factor (Ser/Thr protein kinase)